MGINRILLISPRWSEAATKETAAIDYNLPLFICHSVFGVFGGFINRFAGFLHCAFFLAANENHHGQQNAYEQY
jgi:hypothetical protein